MVLSDKVKAAILGFAGVVTIAGAKYNAQEIVQKYENGEIDEKEMALLLEENQLDKVDNLSDINEELNKLGVEVAENEEDIVSDGDDDIDGDDDDENIDDDDENIEDDGEDIEVDDDDEDKDDFGDEDDAVKEKEALREKEKQEKAEQQEKTKQETSEEKEKMAQERTDAMKKGAQDRSDAMEKIKGTDIKDDFGDEEDADGVVNSIDPKTDNTERAEDREKFLANFDQKSANELKESDPEQYDRIMAANKMAIREEIDEAGGGETCWDNMSTSEMFDMLDKNPDRAKALMQDYQDRHPYGDCDFESPNTKDLIETRRAESKAERDQNDDIPKDMLESENPYKEFTQVEKTDAQRI